MQKIYCLLFAVLFAQASYAASCVSVKQVSANYATKQVTFDVVWTTCTGTHNYKTWVIVDYRTVNANGTKGAWTRATISGTSIGTLVSASKGVWVTGSTGKTQRVTLTLSGMPAKYDWCASALDYPPVAAMANGTYTLKGTPPFTINGSTALGANVKNYTGACITSVTDATNNPEGIVTNPVFTAGAIASTGQALCSGSAYATIGSTTAASGGDSRITYQWLRNGSVISGATATTYVPTQAGTYTRQAKDGTCNTAWVTSTGSWVVTVVSVPAVPTLSATTTCAGTAITFTSSAVSGATGYQWNGTGVTASSGTGRTTTSKATTAGNYVAQVRSYTTASGISCFSAYTSNVTGVIVATPAVPTLTATNPCYGTAITFTSSSVSGATGYQWTGAGVTASSGTARTKASKATTAGSYIAQVRSYITTTGITCYSAYTSNFTGVINDGGARDKASNSCGCATGLTALNGYCRNLTADGASTFTGCGFEIKDIIQGNAQSAPNLCPTGWSIPTHTQIKCIYNNRQYIGLGWSISINDEFALFFIDSDGSCGGDGSWGCGGSMANVFNLFLGGRWCASNYSVPQGGCVRASWDNGGKLSCIRY